MMLHVHRILLRFIRDRGRGGGGYVYLSLFPPNVYGHSKNDRPHQKNDGEGGGC